MSSPTLPRLKGLNALGGRLWSPELRDLHADTQGTPTADSGGPHLENGDTPGKLAAPPQASGRCPVTPCETEGQGRAREPRPGLRLANAPRFLLSLLPFPVLGNVLLFCLSAQASPPHPDHCPRSPLNVPTASPRVPS